MASVKPIKVTFHLDGSGVLYNPAEPTMLDGILAWCLSAYHVSGHPPSRNEEPSDIPIPLKKWHMKNGVWGWHASALFPEGQTAESLQFWRSRFREDRIELTSGSPNRTNGTYRDWQMPMPLTLCHKMVAYAVGNRSDVHKILRRGVSYIGKKTSMGKGRVVGIDVEWVDEDYSIRKDGKPMRWYPEEDGPKLVRPRPPYWSNVGRVRCCDITYQEYPT